MDQLWKEREERAEMLREAKDEAMRAMGILEAPEGREEATGAPWQDTWLAAALEELTNAIR